MKKQWKVFLAFVPAFFVLAMLFGRSSAALQEPQPYLPQPSTYYVDGNLGIITDTVTSTVYVNGLGLAQTINWGGKTLWAVPAIEGTYTVTSEQTSVWLKVEDLVPGEIFTDSLGSYVKANNTRSGIAVYSDESSGYRFYSIAGEGYDGWFPAGSHWWNYTAGAWSTNAVWGPFTFVAVPISIAPHPTPTEPPTVDPVMHTLYLPLMMAPHACLTSSPFLPFYWQEEEQLGVCSAPVPPHYNSVAAMPSTEPGFNWTYPGVDSGIIAQNSDRHFTYLGFVAASETIGVHEHLNTGGFDAVYTIVGEGFHYYRLDVTDEVRWWDPSTKNWTSTPVWSVYNIMGVNNR